MKGGGVSIVDRPTQLFYIWIFICKYTNVRDTAGQSATVGPTPNGKFHFKFPFCFSDDPPKPSLKHYKQQQTKLCVK